MAMSKVELLEMVEQTITSNGAKEITGASLNAALTAIIEAMGTGSGGGGGASAEQIYSDFRDGTNLTPEQKAINAQTYAKVKSAFENGSPLPLITVDVSSILAIGSSKVEVLATLTAFFDPNDATNIENNAVGLNILMNVQGMDLDLVVSEDGSCVTRIG